MSSVNLYYNSKNQYSTRDVFKHCVFTSYYEIFNPIIESKSGWKKVAYTIALIIPIIFDSYADLILSPFSILALLDSTQATLLDRYTLFKKYPELEDEECLQLAIQYCGMSLLDIKWYTLFKPSIEKIKKEQPSREAFLTKKFKYSTHEAGHIFIDHWCHFKVDQAVVCPNMAKFSELGGSVTVTFNQSDSSLFLHKKNKIDSFLAGGLAKNVFFGIEPSSEEENRSDMEQVKALASSLEQGHPHLRATQIIEERSTATSQILEGNKERLKYIAEMLFTYEALDEEDITNLFDQDPTEFGIQKRAKLIRDFNTAITN